MPSSLPTARPLRWLGLASLGAGVAAVALAVAGESAGARKAILVALALGGIALFGLAVLVVIVSLRPRRTP